MVKKLSEEHRKRISESLKGHKCSQITRLMISLANKNRKPWCKGLTKETDERVMKKALKMKEIHKERKWGFEKGEGYWSGKKRPEVTQRNLINNPMRNELTRKKSSITHKENFRIGKEKAFWKDKKIPLEARIKQSDTRKRFFKEGKINAWNKGRRCLWSTELNRKNWSNPDYRKKHSGENHPMKKIENRMKLIEKWKNIEFKEKMIRLQKKGQKRPNKKEQILYSFIGQLTNNYRINTPPNITVINEKIPDFINVNGEKKVINFNGMYWHLWKNQNADYSLTKEQVEERERKPYQDYGFKILFIWEDELSNKEMLIEKLRGFINEP